MVVGEGGACLCVGCSLLFLLPGTAGNREELTLIHPNKRQDDERVSSREGRGGDGWEQTHHLPQQHLPQLCALRLGEEA